MSDRPSNVSQDNSDQIIPVDQEPLVAVPERSPDHEVPAAQHLEELTREVLELKLDYLSEAENRSRSLKRLRAQVKWLTGILLVAIAVLGGSLIWLTYSLNLFPNQLGRKIQSKTPEQQELKSLKSEVRSLGEQLPQTARLLQGNQNKVTFSHTDRKRYSLGFLTSRSGIPA